MDTALTQLEGYVSSGNHTSEGMKLLQQLKVAWIMNSGTGSASSTVSSSSDGSGVMMTEDQYVQALECGVFLSIQLQDLDIFTRHVQLLQPFYYYNNHNNNYNNSINEVLQQQHPTTTKNNRMNHIIGLYLMSLLVTASSSEFHSELELLFNHNRATTGTAITEDPYIQFPIVLERKLMVGIYDEIFDMTVPDITTYTYFMEQLVLTIRDTIADCLEVSYASLSLSQTATLMKFNHTTIANNNTNNTTSIPDLLEYVEVSRNDWILDHTNDRIIFQGTSTNTTTMMTGQDVPSQQWIQQALTYATEMERII